MKLILTCVLVLFSSISLLGQDLLEQARKDIDTLCSHEMAGRAYVHDGHIRAANFIAGEFKKYGLLPLDIERDYLQEFPLKINLFKTAELSIQGNALEAGKDFIINRFSGSGEGKFEIVDLGHGLESVKVSEIQGKVILFRSGWPEKMIKNAALQKPHENKKNDLDRVLALLAYQPQGFIILKPKLTYGFAKDAAPVPIIELLAESLPKKHKRISWNVQADLDDLTSQNVVGILPGSQHSDSAVIVCAHYDHMGKLGSAIFPGANDNASGMAMLLALLRHFSQAEHRLPYPLVFIAFGGEETGLDGSRYYATRKPLFPLDQTHFVLNLDLMGNGTEGITAVAGNDFPGFFQKLEAANEQTKAVTVVKKRSNRPNSDHYFFVREGVPAFFVFTLGGPPHYHDIYDTPANLELSRFEALHGLFVYFLKHL